MNVRSQTVLAFSLAGMGLALWPAEAPAQTCSPPQNVTLSPTSGTTYSYGCYRYNYFTVRATGTKPQYVTVRVAAPSGGYRYPSTRTATMYGSSVRMSYFYMRRPACGTGVFPITVEVRNNCGTTRRVVMYDMRDVYPPRMYSRFAPCYDVYSPYDTGHYGNRAYDNCGRYYVAGEVGSQFLPPERKTELNCIGNYNLYRDWRVWDCNGNSGTSTQLVYVRDYYPPTVIAGSGNECVWPPNHELVTFTEDEFQFSATDQCGVIASKDLTGCSSDEPDEAHQDNNIVGGCNGDGNRPNDCQQLGGGAIGVRSERCGDGDGRTYSIEGRACDDCGNCSRPATVGTVDVPHDTSMAHEWEMECIAAD